MQVLHSSKSEFTPADTSAALARLQQRVTEFLEGAAWGTDFECFERELHAAFSEAECEVTADGLQSRDINLPHVLIDGVVHYRVLRSPKTYCWLSH